MRSVTASYYSQESVHSILSTLENHTSENQIDFKTSIHVKDAATLRVQWCWSVSTQ